MPVDFLTEEQQRRYGRYAGEPSADQLSRYFHLDDDDLLLLSPRRGDHNRLGFALQISTVRFLGTFLDDPIDVPPGVVAHLRRQLRIADSTCLPRYMNRRTTRHEHVLEIKKHYGYQDFRDQPGHFRLVRWLYTRTWLSSEQPGMLFDLATARLVERKVLLPGVTVLARLIAVVRDRAAARLWRALAATPNAAQRERLEALLLVPEGARQSRLDQLRRGPTRVSGPALIAALDRLVEIRALGVGELPLPRVPAGRLKMLARYAAAARAQAIARMPSDRRIATLLAFARAFEATALDDALDLMDLLITDIVAQAQHLGQQERLRTLRDLDAAALQLREACAVLFDKACADRKVRATVFARVPEPRLRDAVALVESLARPSEDNYHKELVGRYGRVCRFLPAVLREIAFRGTQAGQPILQALKALVTPTWHQPDLSRAPMDIVSRAWRRLVVGPDHQIDRRAYTLCVLECLQDGLRRRDVFVSPSERWGDPRAKLLHGAIWETDRPRICQILGRQSSVEGELDTLAKDLDAVYRRTLANLPANIAVRIESVAGRDTLTLTPLDKLDEPPSLQTLRQAVSALCPRVDLPEALLEIHARTGFADEFTHLSEAAARVSDLPISLCAVLLAEACNIGLGPLVRRDVPALTGDRLAWIQQNYIRAETLTRANARLVAAQAKIPLAQTWGGGEVASADGLRFVVPVRTVNAGPNSKYFGTGRGITYYNFTSDQFTGFHGIVIPGTLRDSLFILEGLLEHQTSLNPHEVMSDTAGYSDVVFGLFWLLGYQFSPRLADLGEARFWRIDATADYGVLDRLARHRVNTKLIARNWDDMLRVAGSLKLGTISASELMRSLLRSSRPSTLARAIGELGRVPKTLYLLSYIDDPAYRRRILTQLNRGEARHAVARATFHGNRGEVRQRYREGQEDQLGALGLVVNVLVLWNTLYTEAALNHLRSQGEDVKPEDIARLSPLEYQHVNFLGRYSFALAEPIARGELRPLRDPDEELSP
jgi:TnpA family transposase